MQDKYYSTPLHGVECCLPNTICSGSQPLSVKLVFDDVSVSQDQSPIWTLKDQGTRYLTELNLFIHSNIDFKSQENSYLLSVNCEGKGRFLIEPEQITIDWDQGTSSSHYFQTLALALWLEIKQVLCIHANALKRASQTFALVAASGTGKSTLSAQLQQKGCQWLTDDMMALHQVSAENEHASAFQVFASWPIARMWPDAVENTLGNSASDLDKVHSRFDKRLIEFSSPKEVSGQSSELSVMYILNRIDVDDASSVCEIETLNSSEGLILLLKHSILGDAYKALGIEVDRMRQLSTLVKSVKVRKITYTSGKGNLDLVSKLIFEDLDKRQIAPVSQK